MVRSMIAGVAGLKTHQSKLDVIGNNIANVNTWGFKSASFHFKDSMYTTSINGSAGSVLGGAAGGGNASQVGYGTTTSSITMEYGKGAPSPSNNPLDCMIDGTGFFLVGNMVNGAFTNIEDSGLNLSRVGIFRVDGNGYLVDDQRSYVYGYGLVDGTGIPEKPATKATYTVENAKVEITQDPADGTYSITIGKQTVDGIKAKDFNSQLDEWIAGVTSTKDPNALGQWSDYVIEINNSYDGGGKPEDASVSLTFTKKTAGSDAGNQKAPAVGNFTAATNSTLGFDVVDGSERIAGTAPQYSDELSAIRIPIDPYTGQQYDIQSYKINSDGTIMGVDTQDRTIAIGQLALVTVENPNGLEKTDGYYYSIGPNAGNVGAIKPNGGPAGAILGNYLEMANVDLASEFTQMITTQRGYQANSKIITVTDQMLEELVNMKR